MPSLSILDVAPLLLHSLEIPIPIDFEGRVPGELFEPGYLQSHPVRFGASTQAGSDSSSEEAPAIDANVAAEVMQHLRALGYVE